MSGENWRIGTDGRDYFGQQQKKGDVEQRRPVIRQASDLVGPGIGSSAVRISDFNNVLATFNGYYSAAVGTLNAPNAGEAFVGQVVMDSEYGGWQMFTGMTSGVEYKRKFTRSPTSAETIGWGVWTGSRIPATATGLIISSTLVPSSFETPLEPPQLNVVGDDIYLRTEVGVQILQQGVYTGYIQVGANSLSSGGNIYIRLPDGAAAYNVTHFNVVLTSTAYYPVTFMTTVPTQVIGVSVYHVLSGTNNRFWYRMGLTRVGDAV